MLLASPAKNSPAVLTGYAAVIFRFILSEKILKCVNCGAITINRKLAPEGKCVACGKDPSYKYDPEADANAKLKAPYRRPIFCFIVYLVVLLAFHKPIITGLTYEPDLYSLARAQVVNSSIYKNSPAKSFRTYFNVRIEYTYRVNGVIYQSDLIDLRHNQNRSFHNKLDAELFISQFRKGAEVDIYYKKNNPSFSVLRLENRITLKRFVNWNSAFVIFFLIWLLKGLITYRKLKAAKILP